MNYMEFIARADLMVKELFPEWHVEGTPIGVNTEEVGVRYATTSRLMDGRLAIEIYPYGYRLAVVEDLATVLLHEYVHVKIWDELEKSIPTDTEASSLCKASVHEIMAYGVELDQDRLTVTEGMRDETLTQYRVYYVQGTSYCPTELMKIFPLPEGYSLRI